MSTNKKTQENNYQLYQVLIVKPYTNKEGEKKYSYSNIGVAFKKIGSSILDLKLNMFPIMTDGSFIQLKAIYK